ncbi:hypothetical protein L7F22_021586 [Adiantum nelumboides]|nr:hypothetical protein [Adiantum nelumboides]
MCWSLFFMKTLTRMEHVLAWSFHGPSQERPVSVRTATFLPQKFKLLSRNRGWSHLSGLNEGSVTAKQNGQAEDSWNANDDEDMLRLMEGFADSLPIIRTYKNELCTLEICGSAPRLSVLTAMAADKSYFAASNLLRGRPLTIRQTVLPGASGVNSTISTKLFAPSLQVVERAKKLSLPKGLSSGEFLHKFFEAVEMFHLSKFYVKINAPGTLRNLSALDKEERIQPLYSFEALNTGALNKVGKALALYAVFGLRSEGSGNTFSNLMKKLWKKDEWVPSQASAVRFRELSVEEIQNKAKLLADSIDPVTRRRAERLWWPVPVLAMKTAKSYLDKATVDWIYEYVPMHKMCVDPEVLDTQGATEARLPRQPAEFDLTHAQLVDLAGVFDMFYEDRFTLSDKDFQTEAILDFHSVSRSKTARFLEVMTLGSLILGAAIFAWLVSSRLRGPSNRTAGNLVLNTVDVAVISKSELPSIGTNDESNFPVNEQLPAEEMQSLCKLVIAKLVGTLAWNVDIRSDPSKGAWTESRTRGPQNLINSQEDVSDAIKEPLESSLQAEDEIKGDHIIEKNSQKEKIDHAENDKEIPIFQVALSIDGTILGFQPLNEAATYCWASMPLAQSLHNVTQLKPGFWERPLKFRRPPSDVVVLELHVDPASLYAFARPFPM